LDDGPLRHLIPVTAPHFSGEVQVTTDACVATDEWHRLAEEADEPITMQDLLGATRARRHRERWNIDQAAEAVHRRARRVVHRAIGNLDRDEADAKDRRLLHYLESSLDGQRLRSCIASIGNIGVRTDLSPTQVHQRLHALIARGRVVSVEGANGGVGYRVQLSPEEHQRADLEVRQMWKRIPVYGSFLQDVRYEYGFGQFENEIRLHWTRHLWRSSLEGFVKSAGIECAQFVDRTGDAPFCRFTCRTLAERTGYSAERMRQALGILEAERVIEVQVHRGRGDRGAGMEVRLRLVNWQELKDRRHALSSPDIFIAAHEDEEVGIKTAKSVDPLAVR
jgi:DNA-binding Lrp family transcriptional regulator